MYLNFEIKNVKFFKNLLSFFFILFLNSLFFKFLKVLTVQMLEIKMNYGIRNSTYFS